ncbi:Uncharacterised protein [Candidatus Tiddalikarchaeum anstoanum]|nr:Uncharacterised protein [Candidatus Tiddalikarchaeum anstoanum]
MVEALIVLSKEEASPKLKKLEKKILQVFEEHNTLANGGLATELSFMVNMEEKDLKEVVKVIEKFGKEEGFETEVIKQ